jgi:hypothetical protein
MVKHLPLVIKELLSIRNQNPLPGPPLGKLNELLTSAYRDARQKKAETGWLVLTVIIQALGSCFFSSQKILTHISYRHAHFSP